MKVVHWNISKKSHPMFGLKKYEDELFNHLRKMKVEWEIERVWRGEGKIRGSTVASWISYKSNDADIVHATSQTIAPAVYLTGQKRFIVTVHDLAPMVYPSEIKDISMKIQFLLTPKALKRAEKIIAISEFTKKELIRLVGADEDRISVVHLGVDHERYRPLDTIRCKERLGLNPDEKHILVVSSNLEHKRMDLAKKVFNNVRAVRKDVKMIKAGYGEVLLGEGIASLGWVSEEDMPTLMNAADVYLHTSEYEGFGLTVLEAMACGVPLVVSNKASIPEVVGEYEKTADESLGNYVDQFVDSVLKKIDNGKDEKAKERSKKFSWRRTAEETAKIYEETLKEV